VRWFGVNPFTEGSYLLYLRLALLYLILSLLVVWLLGGEGILAGITLLLAVESGGWRRLAAILLGGLGLFFFHWHPRYHWCLRARCRCRVYSQPAALQTLDRSLLVRVQSLLYHRSVAGARLGLAASG